MGTAQEWEKENTKHLKEIKDAMENNDPFLAEEIRNIIAPSPKGENVKEPKSFVDSLMDRILEVIDPVTGLLDNPHGPAVIEGDGTRKWYRRGMLHNPAGPAILQADGTWAYDPWGEYHFEWGGNEYGSGWLQADQAVAVANDKHMGFL